nr:serine/threonine/dual specificity protein kinase, catalytic domain-containing protein [Tanacetum cinerariifolium]
VDVAIKRSNLDSNQGTSDFSEEIEMLSKFRHRHIVSLLRYCEDSSTREMILVYEYMPNESFHHHSHKRKANGRNSEPTSCFRLPLYWHGCRKFGLANQLGTTNVYTGLIRGTFGYMDVEYLSTHRITRKSDVYAFVVVLLETLCVRLALNFTLDEQQHSLAGWAKHYIKESKISQIIDPCLRGKVSANCVLIVCLKEFRQIAYECLLTSSKDRPTMTNVLSRLEFVLAIAESAEP